MKQNLDIYDPQHEDNDDQMVGSIISRRAALRLFGAAAHCLARPNRLARTLKPGPPHRSEFGLSLEIGF